jgi:hypothetical protein
MSLDLKYLDVKLFDSKISLTGGLPWVVGGIYILTLWFDSCHMGVYWYVFTGNYWYLLVWFVLWIAMFLGVGLIVPS